MCQKLFSPVRTSATEQASGFPLYSSVTFRWYWLCLPLSRISIPAKTLPPTTFAAKATVPPTVLASASRLIATPTNVLQRSVVPAASSPMTLASMVLPVVPAPAILTPLTSFPEMTFACPPPVPPIWLLVAALKIETPCRVFPRSIAPCYIGPKVVPVDRIVVRAVDRNTAQREAVDCQCPNA
jgi:hypothetical protein